MKKIFAFIITISLNLTNFALAQSNHIKWQHVWSEEIFQQAKIENKLIILDLEAIWCHWCHVMDQNTYSNPKIIELIDKNFIALKIDQDSRPDLADRYKDYGWPATIILNSKATELVKRAGYIEPKEMLSLLEQTSKNHDQVIDATESSESIQKTSFSSEIESKLLERHYKSLDLNLGGLNTSHRYIDADSLEFALKNSEKDQRDLAWAKLTLDNNLKLIDPIWGGVYQYSVSYNWDTPHFEKIVTTQTNNINAYTYAYNLFSDAKYLDAAEKTFAFLLKFMSAHESGNFNGFYTSMDADLVKGQHSDQYFKLSDPERRKLGIPAIDKNIYARENGLIIASLARLYAATAKTEYLDWALKTAQVISASHKIEGLAENQLGFSHSSTSDKKATYLADNLAICRGFFEIYKVTADRQWLQKAVKIMDFIKSNFIDATQAGVFSSKYDPNSLFKAARTIEQNIEFARLSNLLAHYTGAAKYKEFAQSSLNYLANVAFSNVTEAGIILASQELNSDPLHITIVGNKNDPQAKELFMTGLKIADRYKRIEWWDKQEGPMPNPDVEYPQLSKAAAFICTNKRCSLPIFMAENISKTISSFQKK